MRICCFAAAPLEDGELATSGRCVADEEQEAEFFGAKTSYILTGFSGASESACITFQRKIYAPEFEELVRMLCNFLVGGAIFGHREELPVAVCATKLQLEAYFPREKCRPATPSPHSIDSKP